MYQFLKPLKLYCFLNYAMDFLLLFWPHPACSIAFYKTYFILYCPKTTSRKFYCLLDNMPQHSIAPTPHLEYSIVYCLPDQMPYILLFFDHFSKAPLASRPHSSVNRVSDVDYLVNVKGKHKVYQVNMLRLQQDYHPYSD